MAKTSAEIMIDRLVAWGVTTIFGLPGDGINGIMEALRKNRDRITFIQVRHEEAAAFMACGYAKFSGKLGVCLATSGPGAIHLLNGLYDAKMDGAPVLAITGQTYHDLLGTSYQQEVNLLNLFQDVTVYNQMLTGAQQMESITDIACRTALSRRGVAHLSLPSDLQDQKLSEDKASDKQVKGHTGASWQPPIQVPRQDEIVRAAALLNQGKKTVILAGQGAIGAREELIMAADKLGAPIVKSLLGKGAVPDDSPFTTGGLGLLGTRPSEVAMEECDSLLMVGTNFPYMDFLPDPGQAKAVQIDADSSRIGLRYAVDVGLAGDAKATLRTLLPLLERRADRTFLEFAQFRMKEWRELMQDRETREDSPLKPQFVAGELDKLLSDDAIITGDSGTNTTFVARCINIRGNQMFSCSGNLATMAPGLPYAIAAQVAYPKRQVVAFVGDGGITMLMGELATAAKHKLPIKVVVIKNNTLGQIRWEQMVFLGNPEYGCELWPIDFVKVAEACGVAGFRCEKPGEVRSALASALRHDGPALVEAVVDPNEAPMPASVKPKQALHMAEALARGTPHRGKIALTLFRTKIRDYF
jgi:thiamine pyrophosphate-dependent acetolactate synthase large subunit-like protein